MPGSSFRNTFSTSRSSYTIEVFDCSAPIGRAGSPSRTSSSASASSNANRPCSVSIVSRRSNRAISSAASAGSASASNVPGASSSW